MTRCRVCHAPPAGPWWIPSWLRRFFSGGVILNKGWHCDGCLWKVDSYGCWQLACRVMHERIVVGR